MSFKRLGFLLKILHVWVFPSFTLWFALFCSLRNNDMHASLDFDTASKDHAPSVFPETDCLLVHPHWSHDWFSLHTISSPPWSIFQIQITFYNVFISITFEILKNKSSPWGNIQIRPLQMKISLFSMVLLWISEIKNDFFWIGAQF